MKYDAVGDVLQRYCWRREKLMDGSRTDAEINKEVEKWILPKAKHDLWEIVKGCAKKKVHKKSRKDCGDCGLFNVVKGEVCDCEYNQAITETLANIERLFKGEGE